MTHASSVKQTPTRFELDLELMAAGATSQGRPPFRPDFAWPLGVLRNVLSNPPLVA